MPLADDPLAVALLLQLLSAAAMHEKTFACVEFMPILSSLAGVQLPAE